MHVTPSGALAELETAASNHTGDDYVTSCLERLIVSQSVHRVCVREARQVRFAAEAALTLMPASCEARPAITRLARHAHRWEIHAVRSRRWRWMRTLPCLALSCTRGTRASNPPQEITVDSPSSDSTLPVSSTPSSPSGMGSHAPSTDSVQPSPLPIRSSSATTDGTSANHPPGT